MSDELREAAQDLLDWWDNPDARGDEVRFERLRKALAAPPVSDCANGKHLVQIKLWEQPPGHVVRACIDCGIELESFDKGPYKVKPGAKE